MVQRVPKAQWNQESLASNPAKGSSNKPADSAHTAWSSPKGWEGLGSRAQGPLNRRTRASAPFSLCQPQSPLLWGARKEHSPPKEKAKTRLNHCSSMAQNAAKQLVRVFTDHWKWLGGCPKVGCRERPAKLLPHPKNMAWMALDLWAGCKGSWIMPASFFSHWGKLAHIEGNLPTAGCTTASQTG